MKRETKLIEPQLSYEIVGILFQVHRELGHQYQEKYYQRALSVALKKEGLNFKEQLPVNLTFGNESVGKYFIDFLIEGKIVLEIKTVPRLTPKDFKQVSSYLKANGLELGILANFRPKSLIFKRVLNPELKDPNYSD